MFLAGALVGGETPDLGLSLANTRWLLLESYGRGSRVVWLPEPDQRIYSKY